MHASQPFLNSVYGDNHDQAVMSPLSREEFVVAASERGLAKAMANSVYSLGGGPDAVYESLIVSGLAAQVDVVSSCLERVGSTVDQFLKKFAIENRVSLEQLVKLATGELSEIEEHSIVGSRFAPFLAKRGRDGRLVCVSAIIARRLVSLPSNELAVYDQVLRAFERGDIKSIRGRIDSLSAVGSRTKSFSDLLHLYCAVNGSPEDGLLGIEWADVKKSSGRLLTTADLLDPLTAKWVSRMALWSSLECFGGGRLQLDVLTRSAADPLVRSCILFILARLVLAIDDGSRNQQIVRDLVNVPEAILQSISVAMCGVPFESAPENFPDANYQEFSGHRGEFKLPAAGEKVTIGSLLVIVPAILSSRKMSAFTSMLNAEDVKKLQQRFVDSVRNPASHTVVQFGDKDAKFLLELCTNWMLDWARYEGYRELSEVPGLFDQPQVGQLHELLFS